MDMSIGGSGFQIPSPESLGVQGTLKFDTGPMKTEGAGPINPFADDVLDPNDPSILSHFANGGDPLQSPDATNPQLTPDPALHDAMMQNSNDKTTLNSKEETTESREDAASGEGSSDIVTNADGELRTGGAGSGQETSSGGGRGDGGGGDSQQEEGSGREFAASNIDKSRLGSDKKGIGVNAQSGIESDLETAGTTAAKQAESSDSIESNTAQALPPPRGTNPFFRANFAISMIQAMNELITVLMALKNVQQKIFLAMSDSSWKMTESNMQQIDIKAKNDIKICEAKILAAKVQIGVAAGAMGVSVAAGAMSGRAGNWGRAGTATQGMSQSINSIGSSAGQIIVETATKNTIQSTADAEKQKEINNSLKESFSKIQDLMTSGMQSSADQIRAVIDAFYQALQKAQEAWKR